MRPLHRFRLPIAIALIVGLALSGVGVAPSAAVESVHMLSVSDPTGPEGNTGTTSLTFQVSLNVAAVDPITVGYRTVDGTAQSTVVGTSSADFTPTSGSLTFTTGQTSKSVSVPLIGDTRAEPGETFKLVLENEANASVTKREGTGTITNDDAAPVFVTVDDETVSEAAPSVSFTITQSAVSAQDTRVAYATSNDTATAGSDYTSTTGTATIPAGQTTVAVVVPITPDNVDELDEKFNLDLAPTAANASVSDTRAVATITDDEPTPVISINDLPTLPESGTATFTVTLSGTSDRNVTVQYTTTNGTATAGQDYTTTPGTLTFVPGDTSENIAVPVLADTADEPNETFNVVLSAPVNATCTTGKCQGVGTITDDEAELKVNVANDTALEGTDTQLEFLVTLGGTSGSPVTVDYATSDGTAKAPGDYTTRTGTLTIPAGQDRGTITVPIANDSIDEPLSETLTLTLSNPSGATCTGGDCIAAGTITDEDAAPTVRVDDAQGSEPSTPVAFTLTLSAPSEQSFDVAFATSNGTAVAPGDYTATSGTVTFEPGETTQPVSVPVANDLTVEGRETFDLTLSGAVACTSGDCVAVGTILDDESPKLSINDGATTEGNGASTGTIQFTVSTTATSANPITFTYATADRTAKAGSDYTADSGTGTIAAGMSSTTIEIDVLSDGFAEPTEYFLVNLSAPQGAEMDDGQGKGTITDNDTTATDTASALSIADASGPEGTGGTATMTFTVTRTGPSSAAAALSQTVTVEYATRNRTPAEAVAGTDYTAKTGTVTFAPGVDEQTISIDVTTDGLDEIDERFEVVLSEPSNATITDDTAIGTITDDDGPTVAIVDAPGVAEGNGTAKASFLVRLSEASPQAVTVQVTTADGTALAPGDYTARSAVTVTFPAGDTEEPFLVDLAADAVDEVDETFTATLSSPTRATIGDGDATGTILDDDGPTISIDDPAAVIEEAGAKVTFTVTLSGPSVQTVTVNAATADQSATMDDYIARSSTPLTFAPGITEQLFEVTLQEDALNESSETFLVQLTDANDATIANGAGVGTITDDDPAPTIAISSPSVSEGDSGTINANFTITLSAPSSKTITAKAETANGTAVAPADYVATTESFTFDPGQTTRTFSVAVNGDTIDEIDETFSGFVSEATNVSSIGPAGTATITDDDALPAISIGDSSIVEGDSGTKAMTFTVTQSAVSSRNVTFSYGTTSGTATASIDYATTTGTAFIAAGATSTTLTVNVAGDTVDEPNETFTVTLADPANGTIADGTGAGTIADDDPTPATTTTPAPQGYSLVGEDGSLYAFGTAKNLGDMRGKPLNAPIIGVAYTPGGNGYWLVAKDGGIFTFGDADFFGSMGDQKLNSPVIGMAATPTGKGYWLFAGDGGIFTFGDAEFFGSMGDQKLNAPVINMEPLDSGRGYWLVAADGGIFTFGLGDFFGSMGDKKINQPVFDMTSSDTDRGYWLVARDGGIFSFGDAEAKFFGSAVNETPRPTKIIGMDATPGSQGYWIADASGKIYRYGDAQDLGDRSGAANPAPMVAFATVPSLKP